MAEIRLKPKEDGTIECTGAHMHFVDGPITSHIVWEKTWIDIDQGWTSFVLYFKNSDELRMFTANLAIQASGHTEEAQNENAPI
jgi:hypothetical protein